MSPRVPSYRLHKPTGQAVVTLGGKDYYLGKHGTDASQAEYRRLVAEWLAAGGHAPARSSDATVVELIVGYIQHADAYYVKDGRPTSEAGLIRLALRVLRQLYGHTRAAEVGPVVLKTLCRTYTEAGLCRGEANHRVNSDNM